jgi:type I restriction-modification system DNA methylase subunit
VDFTKEFIKTFDRLARRHDRHRAFLDFLALSSSALMKAADPWRAEKHEAAYMETARRYDSEELTACAHLLALTTKALEDEPQDFLGHIYMHLELGNKHAGQFFTPYELCVCMAEMTLADVTEDDPRELITFQEPAVGAGATIIAVMDALKKRGINYQRRTYTVAVDVSEMAARMAYIQFSLLGIHAHVVWGNTLSLQVTDEWPTWAYGLVAHKVARWRRGEAGQSMSQTGQTMSEPVPFTPPPAEPTGQLMLF